MIVLWHWTAAVDIVFAESNDGYPKPWCPLYFAGPPCWDQNTMLLLLPTVQFSGLAFQSTLQAMAAHHLPNRFLWRSYRLTGFLLGCNCLFSLAGPSEAILVVTASLVIKLGICPKSAIRLYVSSLKGFEAQKTTEVRLGVKVQLSTYQPQPSCFLLDSNHRRNQIWLGRQYMFQGWNGLQGDRDLIESKVAWEPKPVQPQTVEATCGHQICQCFRTKPTALAMRRACRKSY